MMSAGRCAACTASTAAASARTARSERSSSSPSTATRSGWSRLRTARPSRRARRPRGRGRRRRSRRDRHGTSRSTGHDEDRRCARGLQQRQQVPDLVDLDRGVDGDLPGLGERQHRRRAHPGQDARGSRAGRSSGAFSITIAAVPARARRRRRASAAADRRARAGVSTASRFAISTASEESSEPMRRRPFALAVEPVETRSTTASERPEAGRGLDRARDRDELGLDARLRQRRPCRNRVGRRDAQAREVGERLLRRGDRNRRLERAPREAELGEPHDVGLRLGDEVRAGDPERGRRRPARTRGCRAGGRAAGRPARSGRARAARARLPRSGGPPRRGARARAAPSALSRGRRRASGLPGRCSCAPTGCGEARARTRPRRGAATAPRA